MPRYEQVLLAVVEEQCRPCYMPKACIEGELEEIEQREIDGLTAIVKGEMLAADYAASVDGRVKDAVINIQTMTGACRGYNEITKKCGQIGLSWI